MHESLGIFLGFFAALQDLAEAPTASFPPPLPPHGVCFTRGCSSTWESLTLLSACMLGVSRNDLIC